MTAEPEAYAYYMAIRRYATFFKYTRWHTTHMVNCLMSCLETENITTQHVLHSSLRNLLKTLMYCSPLSFLNSRAEVQGHRTIHNSLNPTWRLSCSNGTLRLGGFLLLPQHKNFHSYFLLSFYYPLWAKLLGDIFLSSFNINEGILTGLAAAAQRYGCICWTVL